MISAKTVLLAAAIAVAGVAASAGGLSAPSGDSRVTPAPMPAQQGSLGGILPVVGIIGLLLLVGKNSSGT